MVHLNLIEASSKALSRARWKSPTLCGSSPKNQHELELLELSAWYLKKKEKSKGAGALHAKLNIGEIAIFQKHNHHFYSFFTLKPLLKPFFLIKYLDTIPRRPKYPLNAPVAKPTTLPSINEIPLPTYELLTQLCLEAAYQRRTLGMHTWELQGLD